MWGILTFTCENSSVVRDTSISYKFKIDCFAIFQIRKFHIWNIIVTTRIFHHKSENQ